MKKHTQRAPSLTANYLVGQPIEKLLKFRDKINGALEHKKRDLQQQIDVIQGTQTRMPNGGLAFQSKKDPNLVWSGRGRMPVWMKAEMKAGKLNKGDFRQK